MDLLKNCTTNVQSIPDIGKIRVLRYGRRSPGDSTNNAIASLRANNVLCSTLSDQLWVFQSTVKDVVLDAANGMWTQQQDSTIEQLAQDASSPVHEALLAAVEGSLNFTLAWKHGAVKCGSWSWAFALDTADNEGHALLHIRAQITQSGSLYLTSTMRTSRMKSLRGDDTNEGDSIVLAPSGVSATVVGSGEDHLGSGEATGTVQWKAAVKAALSTDAISLDDDTKWINVLTVRSQRPKPWPLHLCFANPSTPSASNSAGDLPWKQHSSSAYTPAYTDPLALAETWYTTSAERESLLAEPGDVGISLIPETQPSYQFSPLARHDLQSLNGIYPTPPDGLVSMAHPSQQMTSSDHTDNYQPEPVASGRSQPPQSSRFEQDDEDQLMPDTEIPASNRQRISSMASSVGAGKAFESGQQEEDDLFGDDMEGMEGFDGEEVGDADFSFFDEPDETPLGGGNVPMPEFQSAQPETAFDETAMMDTVNEELAGHDDSTLQDNAAHTALTNVQPNPGQEQLEEPTSNPTELPAGNALAPDRKKLSTKPPYKPLSPFGVREELLPPPIPASAAAHTQPESGSRRRESSFGPLSFKTGLSADFATRFGMPTADAQDSRSARPSMTFGKRKRDDDSDDFDSESVDSDAQSDLQTSQGPISDSVAEGRPDPDRLATSAYKPMRPANSTAISRSTAGSSGDDIQHELSIFLGTDKDDNASIQPSHSDLMVTQRRPTDTSSIQEVHGLSNKDLITVAQIIAEQAITCTHSIAGELDNLRLDATSSRVDSDTPLLESVSSTITDIFTSSKKCTLPSIALPREPSNRPVPNPPKGQPRPPQRADTGPDISPVPAPFVRLQRGDGGYEVLPTALDFWEALSLGPASGQKDVEAYCVVPANEDIEDAAEMFLESMTAAYEGARLGTHTRASVPVVDEEGNEAGNGEFGVEELTTVAVDADATMEATFQAYVQACRELGESLATTASEDPARTRVVYILNPFAPDHAQAAHHLSAAFYSLYASYSTRLGPASTKSADLVFQLIPLSLVAAPGSLVLPTAQHMALFAREVYDRCPPCSTSQANIQSAPAIELVLPLPKRISFQLAAEPPRDLLHEGSVLHLAYALSADSQWISAAWSDSTGRQQAGSVFCLRGLCFADVAEDIWLRTLDMMAVRGSSWRVFVATEEHIDAAISASWREVAARRTVRGQVVSVTLLRFSRDTGLQLSLSASETGSTAHAASGGGFLTPVSTPQTAGFGLSPETAAPGTAPPTPAPSDVVAAAEGDPEAHLVETADETWSVLFEPSVGSNLVSHTQTNNFTSGKVTAQAYGALVRRGAGDECLPAVGAELLWTIRIRPNRGGVDDGGQRHAEVLLREVLGMWRGLGILARARGIGEGLVPVHVEAALRGGRGVVGMLKDGSG